MANGELPEIKENEKDKRKYYILYFILYFLLGICLQGVLKFSIFLIFSEVINNIFLDKIGRFGLYKYLGITVVLSLIIIILIRFSEKHLKIKGKQYRKFKIIGISIATITTVLIYRGLSILGL